MSVMYASASTMNMVARAWTFVLANRTRMAREAAVPALLWLMLKIILVVKGDAPALLHSLTDLLLILFALDWFRFALGHRLNPSRRGLTWKGRMRCIMLMIARSGSMILLSTVILLPPTFVIAFLMLAGLDLMPSPEVIPQVVSFALPVAVALASPLLVRFYVYSVALLAGREDVGARDVWRWSRGKGVRLAALMALSLAPGVAMITLAGTMPDHPIVMVIGYAAAGLVLFLSIAVMATTTARSMAGLLIPPLTAD